MTFLQFEFSIRFTEILWVNRFWFPRKNKSICVNFHIIFHLNSEWDHLIFTQNKKNDNFIDTFLISTQRQWCFPECSLRLFILFITFCKFEKWKTSHTYVRIHKIIWQRHPTSYYYYPSRYIGLCMLLQCMYVWWWCAVIRLLNFFTDIKFQENIYSKIWLYIRLYCSVYEFLLNSI